MALGAVWVHSSSRGSRESCPGARAEGWCEPSWVWGAPGSPGGSSVGPMVLVVEERRELGPRQPHGRADNNSGSAPQHGSQQGGPISATAGAEPGPLAPEPAAGNKMFQPDARLRAGPGGKRPGPGRDPQHHPELHLRGRALGPTPGGLGSRGGCVWGACIPPRGWCAVLPRIDPVSIARRRLRPRSRPLRGGGSSFSGLCSGCLWGFSLLLVLRRLSSLPGERVIPRARSRRASGPCLGCRGGFQTTGPPPPRGLGRGHGKPCLCQGLAAMIEKSAANKILMGTYCIL